MKKITILFSILIASISAFAATTLQITMSSANQGDKVLQIVVDNPFSNADDNGYDAVVGAGQQGGLYVVYNSDRYTKYYTNELGNNLPLGFGAVEDSEYTFNFSYFTGTSFTIYDKKLDKTITVADNILVDGVAADPANKYTFSIEDDEKNTAINDRFVINYVAPVTGYNVTLNGAGLATFSAAETTKIPDGLKVYQAGNIANNELVLNQVEDDEYIPANTGVILYGDADQSYFMEIYNDIVAISEDYTSNSLKAYTAWESRTAEPVYILHGSELWQYTGTQFVDNKAFLQLPGGANNAPARISMRFNTTTAVENVETEAVQPVKFIENGEIFIRRGNEVYNLQGQLVK